MIQKKPSKIGGSVPLYVFSTTKIRTISETAKFFSDFFSKYLIFVYLTLFMFARTRKKPPALTCGRLKEFI